MLNVEDLPYCRKRHTENRREKSRERSDRSKLDLTRHGGLIVLVTGSSREKTVKAKDEEKEKNADKERDRKFVAIVGRGFNVFK